MTLSSIPTISPNADLFHSSVPQFEAALHGAGVAKLDGTGWIRVTGEDRVRWLNGMATNSVQDLTDGRGAYNFFLNAQGRIQADGNIFAGESSEPGVLWIETERRQIATLIPYLDHYIIMDDVELADLSGERHGVSLVGPLAAKILSKLGVPVDDLAPLQKRSFSWNGGEAQVIRAHGPLVPRYEVWTGSASDADAFLNAALEAGACSIDSQTLEWLRLLEGTPLYGVDIRDRDLPQETNQTRALHFNKGCYLGQEIVERIRSRGNVHRTFTVFRLEGAQPAPGTILQAAGKQVGELTSVSAIPASDAPLQIGLGYIRREALDRGDRLEYDGGIAYPGRDQKTTPSI
jgi:folate-binding protein YgfZ